MKQQVALNILWAHFLNVSAFFWKKHKGEKKKKEGERGGESREKNKQVTSTL